MILAIICIGACFYVMGLAVVHGMRPVRPKSISASPKRPLAAPESGAERQWALALARVDLAEDRVRYPLVAKMYDGSRSY